MDVDDALAVLRELAADVGPAAGEVALMSSPAAAFPAAHLDLLRQLNGCTVSGGAYRLFGVRAEPHLDLASWNDPQTWRFAWGGLADGYLFIGESAWGDQYGYRVGPGGTLQPEVYRLEAILLGPGVVAASFEEFLTGEFMRNAREPYEPDTVAALARFTAIAADRHWVHAPPLALGGPDSIETVTELPAITAMTIAGDIASALHARPDATPAALVPWTDDRGRDRLRLEYD